MALVKYNNNSISAITSTGLTAGAMTLIKEQTASASATISFVNGTSDVVLDSTYPIYLFKFINIHPATDDTTLTFNFSVDTGSNYNVTKTTSAFRSYLTEQDNESGVAFISSAVVSQGTGFVELHEDTTISNENDFSLNGYLQMYDPSSTVFVKHYHSTMNSIKQDASKDYCLTNYCGGYANTTSAIDALQFKMKSGNIDSGKIKMYGMSDS